MISDPNLVNIEIPGLAEMIPYEAAREKIPITPDSEGFYRFLCHHPVQRRKLAV